MLGKLKSLMRRQPEAARISVPASGTVKVLMVCMGNICRSPTAEGVLRAKLQRAGVRSVVVDSAGTHGYHTSEAPFRMAIDRAKLRGYDLKDLRARPVKPEDFERFDLMLAMDEANLKWLHKRLPDTERERAVLLMNYAARHPGVREVPDPYYGGPDGFDRVLDLVEDACEGVVAALAQQQKQAFR